MDRDAQYLAANAHEGVAALLENSGEIEYNDTKGRRVFSAV